MIKKETDQITSKRKSEIIVNLLNDFFGWRSCEEAVAALINEGILTTEEIEKFTIYDRIEIESILKECKEKEMLEIEER